MREKFEIDILKEIIHGENYDGFFVIDNIFPSFSSPADKIIVIHRSPFEERIIIDRMEYEQRLLSKEREDKLNNIVGDNINRNK